MTANTHGRSKIRVGTSILLVAVLVAAISPFLPSPVPDRALTTSDVYAPPSVSNWLGTDDAGSDVLLEILRGTQVSLLVGLFASLISVGVGGSIGLIAGFVGGRVERVLMRITDIVLVLPALPLAIVLVAVTEPGLGNLILVIGLVGWTGTARLVRAQTLAIKERAFVHRARAMGSSEPRTLVTHVMPHVLPLIAANGALVVSQAILAESTLSFLGLGDPELSSWGRMLSFALARGALSAGAWWALVVPGLAIVSVVLGATLLGFGLEERAIGGARRNHLSTGAPRARRAGRATRAHADAGSEAHPQGEAVAPLLSVRNLTVEYPPRGGEPTRALENATFDLRPGEILGLVGESGCGKTTAMMSMMGLMPEGTEIVSGSIRLDGEELVGRSDAAVAKRRGRDLGLVAQAAMNALNPVRTVRSQIAESIRHAAVQRGEDAPGDDTIDARIHELLERVDLPTDRASRYPFELSGGMRQRVVIAMALAASPRILLADEPTTALDVIVQDQILTLLDDLRHELGLAIVLVTHDLGVVAEICDRVVVMYGGTVAESAGVEETFHAPAHPYTRALLEAFPDLDRPAEELRSIDGFPPRLDPPPAGCRFASRCPVAEERCTSTAPTLIRLAQEHRAACHLLEPVDPEAAS